MQLHHLPKSVARSRGNRAVSNKQVSHYVEFELAVLKWCESDEAAKLSKRKPGGRDPGAEYYASELVGNKIEDPTNPLTAAQIARLIWGKDNDAGRKRAREWMRKGVLPANLADNIKNHYVVSRSALDLLSQADRTKPDA